VSVKVVTPGETLGMSWLRRNPSLKNESKVEKNPNELNESDVERNP
jgi:hypothetical protein